MTEDDTPLSRAELSALNAEAKKQERAANRRHARMMIAVKLIREAKTIGDCRRALARLEELERSSKQGAE